MESRGVLGVPDAYELPAQPGAGFLKSGVDALTRFRAAYVSGPYRRRRAVVQAQVARQVVPWTAEWVVPRAPADPTRRASPTAPEPEGEGDGGGGDAAVGGARPAARGGAARAPGVAAAAGPAGHPGPDPAAAGARSALTA
ncbi:hypothetical protein GCM10023238_14440 [Streptomyces heliomycini]